MLLLPPFSPVVTYTPKLESLSVIGDDLSVGAFVRVKVRILGRKRTETGHLESSLGDGAHGINDDAKPRVAVPVLAAVSNETRAK